MAENQELMSMDVVNPDVMIRMEQAAIDCQIATAKRYPIHQPGQLSKVKDAMLTFATIDEETAQSCFYSLPRGGKVIQGPSVRMAEIAVTCFGNIRSSARTVQVVSTGDTPHVIVQAATHDLENNVAVCIEKRRRITKKKGKDAIDEDDINLAVNAGIAIAFRDAIFKVIPLALVKPVYEAAKRVAIGDIKSLTSKRALVVERLQKMGAMLDRILAVVDARKVDDITLEKLELLIGLGTALKDGDTTLEEAFPPIMEKLEPTQGRKAFGFNKKGEQPPEAPLGDQPPAEEPEKGKDDTSTRLCPACITQKTGKFFRCEGRLVCRECLAKANGTTSIQEIRTPQAPPKQEGAKKEPDGATDTKEGGPAPADAAIPADAQCTCTGGHEFLGQDAARHDDGSVGCPVCGQFVAEIILAEKAKAETPSGDTITCPMKHTVKRSDIKPSALARPGQLGLCPTCFDMGKHILIKG